METTRVRLFISGRVQGVAFRYYTQAEAGSLGLGGWVRNLQDGRVEVLAEGPSERVEQLVQWCHRGPRGARVDAVDVQPEQPKGEKEEFEIRM